MTRCDGPAWPWITIIVYMCLIAARQKKSQIDYDNEGGVYIGWLEKWLHALTFTRMRVL